MTDEVFATASQSVELYKSRDSRLPTTQLIRGHVAELADSRLEFAGDEASASRLKDVHVYPIQHDKQLRAEGD